LLNPYPPIVLILRGMGKLEVISHTIVLVLRVVRS